MLARRANKLKQLTLVQKRADERLQEITLEPGTARAPCGNEPSPLPDAATHNDQRAGSVRAEEGRKVVERPFAAINVVAIVAFAS
jgi:hypothetical protein